MATKAEEMMQKGLEGVIRACHPHSGAQKFDIGRMAERTLKDVVEARMGEGSCRHGDDPQKCISCEMLAKREGVQS